MQEANPFSSAFKSIVVVMSIKLTAFHILNIVQLLAIFILLGKHSKDITHFKKIFFYLPQVKLYILGNFHDFLSL